MSIYFVLFFIVVFGVLVCIGLRYPNAKYDWKRDTRSTAGLLATILISLLLFFLLWFFLAQLRLPDVVTLATYLIFMLIVLLLLIALVLKK